ncbi:hypothetical protein BaRGS_00017427 [Batillaria attramentaria]|uniref:Uncharacterized protein n=1 Tax=Batillaria attramentaria TaxID=370345 RepID=A0ABD0KW72_9CAEN
METYWNEAILQVVWFERPPRGKRTLVFVSARVIRCAARSKLRVLDGDFLEHPVWTTVEFVPRAIAPCRFHYTTTHTIFCSRADFALLGLGQPAAT